jgi:DNA polymerase alpha subunit B
VININEITIGISTVDVLFHLRKEIYFHKATEVPLGSDLPPSSSSDGTPVDMMANVCRSVLNQRMYAIPFFPSV